MSRVRDYGKQRGLAIARTVTSVRVTVSGPAEGEVEIKYVERCKAYRAALRFRGDVYSGWGDTEDGARRKVFENVAGLTGMLVSEVMTEFYGDFEEPISIRR